jgi:hypothetical protein
MIRRARRGIAGLDECDRCAGGLERDRRRHPRKTATDDDHARAVHGWFARAADVALLVGPRVARTARQPIRSFDRIDSDTRSRSTRAGSAAIFRSSP